MTGSREETEDDKELEASPPGSGVTEPVHALKAMHGRNMTEMKRVLRMRKEGESGSSVETR